MVENGNIKFVTKFCAKFFSPTTVAFYQNKVRRFTSNVYRLFLIQQFLDDVANKPEKTDKKTDKKY